MGHRDEEHTEAAGCDDDGKGDEDDAEQPAPVDS
jgi:hypothetical protein